MPNRCSPQGLCSRAFAPAVSAPGPALSLPPLLLELPPSQSKHPLLERLPLDTPKGPSTLPPPSVECGPGVELASRHRRLCCFLVRLRLGLGSARRPLGGELPDGDHGSFMAASRGARWPAASQRGPVPNSHRLKRAAFNSETGDERVRGSETGKYDVKRTWKITG